MNNEKENKDLNTSLDVQNEVDINIEKEVEVDLNIENTENIQPETTETEDENVEEISELKSKAIEIKKELEEGVTLKTNLDSTFLMCNAEGEMVNPRDVTNPKMKLQIIDIESIYAPSRVRYDNEQDTFNLQESLKLFGQLEPIVVIPIFDESDEEDEPAYLLAHGYRRMKALQAIGNQEIVAVVDCTIPKDFIKHYEAIFNSTKTYTFQEQLDYGKFLKETQKLLGYDTIEGILGLKTGEFLKALYIDSFKEEFADIFKQVDTKKLTIEQGFKKIEKEIEKREKEMSAIDELNSGALDDQLRNTNELLDLHNDAGNQEVGNRKVLDAVIRRSIESRDNGYCQCCGYGKNEPDLMGVFHVHHIIAVQYGGSDNKTNLVLVCNNCHTLIHDYEKGRFLPDKTTFDRLKYVQKIVVLGNMLATMKQKGLHYLRTKHPDLFRLVDAGKESLGKTLLKVNADLGGEQLYNNSPYDTFKECAENIDNEVLDVNSDLQTVNWEDNISEENKELKTALAHSGEIEEVVADDDFLNTIAIQKDEEENIILDIEEDEQMKEQMQLQEDIKKVNDLKDIFDISSDYVEQDEENIEEKNAKDNDNNNGTDSLLDGLL